MNITEIPVSDCCLVYICNIKLLLRVIINGDRLLCMWMVTTGSGKAIFVSCLEHNGYLYVEYIMYIFIELGLHCTTCVCMYALY